MDQCNARPSTQQLRCDRHAPHTIGDGSEPIATIIDEFLLEIRSYEVANAGRHTWQYVHDLHARPATRCTPDGLLERRVIGGDGIDIDENGGEGGHRSLSLCSGSTLEEEWP